MANMTKAELLEELEDLKEICDELKGKNKELERDARKQYAWTVEVYGEDDIDGTVDLHGMLIGICTSRHSAYQLAKERITKMENREISKFRSITIKKKILDRYCPIMCQGRIDIEKKDGQWFVKTEIGEFIDAELKGE